MIPLMRLWLSPALPPRPGSDPTLDRNARTSALLIPATGFAPKNGTRWPSSVERSTLMCERRHSIWCSASHCSANAANVGVSGADAVGSATAAAVAVTDPTGADVLACLLLGKHAA